MKIRNFPQLCSIAIVLCLLCTAQDSQRPAAATDLPPAIPSSVFIPPAPPKTVPQMPIEGQSQRKRDTHQITIVRSSPSDLPDIPPPPPDKPQIERRANTEGRYLLSCGATVYDGKMSQVKGYDPRSKKHWEAWCAWDMSLLSPMPEITLADGKTKLLFFLAASQVDTNRLRRDGSKVVTPAMPQMENNQFVITQGSENPETAKILSALRDYSVKHHERLLLIRKAREEYQAAADAWHAENPPKPENHTFWLKPHRGSRYLNEGGER